MRTALRLVHLLSRWRSVMRLTNNAERYGIVAQMLHWLIMLLVCAQFGLALRADALPRGPALLSVLGLHKSVGITIFALMILRLLWRTFNPAPDPPAHISRWQRVAAQISHLALYGLLLLLPLFGWLMSSARNFPVSWFRLFTLPDLIAPSEAAYRFFHEGHELLARMLLLIMLLHVAAALKHHFIDGDNVLMRMLPWRSGKDRSQ
jgi:cytochrome b561